MQTKILILTEKREVASDMAATLGDTILGNNAKTLAELAKKKGFLEGEKYLLSWAAGHLYEQIKAKDINPNYGLWQRFSDTNDYKMPKMKEEITFLPTENAYKEKQRKIIKELLSRKDIQEIIIATDADAEGEAIGRDMIFRSGFTLDTTIEIKRLWNTGSFKAKDSVAKAMSSLKPYNDKKFKNLYDSQRARSTADYLTGMKITKTLTDLYNKPFYTGRVKSVIISLVGGREEDIKGFIPKDFYKLIGEKGDLELSHFYYQDVEDFDKDGKKIMKQEKQRNYYGKDTLDEVMHDLKDLHGTVEKMTTSTTSSKKKPLPLSGSDFASEMMGKYKIKYEQCNEILDYLRQEGFTTYPGTNGRYFSQADEEEVIYALSTASEYFNIKAEFTTDTYIFNDKLASKQNHTPLSITPKVPTQSDVDIWNKHKLPNVKEAYELIAKRIALAFLEDDEIEKQELILSISKNNHKFDLTGAKALTQGWRTFMNMEIKDTTFKSETPLKEGDTISLDKVDTKTSKTKTPLLYTIKTLLDTLLNVTRVVDKLIAETNDPKEKVRLKNVKKQLKNAEGIGTDRTREQIIKDLLNNKMIQSKDKDEKLSLLESGIELFKVMPEQLKSVVLTANWENSIEKIRQGEASLDTVLTSIDNTIMEEMIPHIIENLGKNVSVNPNKTYKKEELSIPCPLCQKMLISTDKVFKCSTNLYQDNKQSGCKFSIFKDQKKFFGRELNTEDLNSLFLTQKEKPLKEKSHGLFFDKDNKYFITVVFNQNDESDTLITIAKTFRKKGKFVFKKFNGKDLTASQAEQLLDGKSIALTRKSKKGLPYKVSCTLLDTGELDAKFINK